jgi:hypothetical protein
MVSINRMLLTSTAIKRDIFIFIFRVLDKVFISNSKYSKVKRGLSWNVFCTHSETAEILFVANFSLLRLVFCRWEPLRSSSELFVSRAHCQIVVFTVNWTTNTFTDKLFLQPFFLQFALLKVLAKICVCRRYYFKRRFTIVPTPSKWPGLNLPSIWFSRPSKSKTVK